MRDFVVCDLETTGADPAGDKIIEIGMVKVARGKITDTFQTLVHPGEKLPVKIKRLTGLTDAMFGDSPALSEVAPRVIEFLGDNCLVGHNVSFDASFLNHHLGLNPGEQLDTLEMARVIFPDAPGHRLADLCNYTGIEVSTSHRALADAEAAARLALKLMHTLRQLGLSYIVHLNNLLKHAGSGWSSFTREVVKEKTSTFTGESLELRYAVQDRKIKNRQSKPGGGQQEIVEEDLVRDIFSGSGTLKKYLDNFETRPQQNEMAVQVARALNYKKCLLMEAGTGTGKTLAYLVPSIMWALANRERVLVATQTINLQEQLWNKDIPLLDKVLDGGFTAALIKGRSNYLCLRRWENMLNRGENLLPEEALFLARVLVWLGRTASGDKNELNLHNREREYWSQVCSDPEACQGSLCRWFYRYCFVSRARREAENADLIITNHSLLFSNMRNDHNILPSYGALVIDEAHHLEDAATSHLGRQVSYTAINRWLKSVYKTSLKLSRLTPPSEGKQWGELLNQLKQERYRVAEQVKELYDILSSYAGSARNNNGSRAAFRIRENDRLQAVLQAGGENLASAFKSVKKILQGLTDLLEIWSADDEIWLEPAWELYELINGQDALVQDLSYIIGAGDENSVYWGEVDTEYHYFTLFAAPVQVGELLHENLFTGKQGIILTSATLTVNGSFQYFMERTGVDLLPEDSVTCEIVSSPFEYERQCLLCVDNNIGLPGEVDSKEYYDGLAGALEEYILASRGRTLVLFTSHSALREIYYRLQSSMEEMDICLLGHNIDGSRRQLIEQFQNSPRSVLLGTSSFWEGIDIPGSALTSVIIVRLPFWPPNMPVNEARIEELYRKGKNGFSHLSLPQAVIRFKQGFGRLIRTSADRGAVIILDKRLTTKKYGKVFLHSLPLKTHVKGNTRFIKDKVSTWLEGGEII